MMQVSGSIKEEREAYPIADQCSVEVRNTFFPAEEVFKIVMVSDNIKEEQCDYPMTDHRSEEVKNVFCPAEQEFNVVMVSDSIKEEGGAYPTADQRSEEVNTAFCPAIGHPTSKWRRILPKGADRSGCTTTKEDPRRAVFTIYPVFPPRPAFPTAYQRPAYIQSETSMASTNGSDVETIPPQDVKVVMVSDSIKEEGGSYPIADQCSEEVNTAFCPARVAEITAFSTNVKKEKDCSLDHQYSRMPNIVGMGEITALSTNVKEEVEEDCTLGHRDSEMRAEEEFNMMQVSGSIKEERETIPVANQRSEEIRNNFCPAAEVFNMMQVLGSIREARATISVADQRSEEVRNTFCPAEDVFNLVMVSDSIQVKRVKNTFCPAEEVFKVVVGSDSITEEREAGPIADPCSEEDKDVFCPAEEVFKIVTPSDKKEQWAFLTNAQCSEEVKNILCPTADPFAKSGISQCFPVSKKTLFQQEMNNEQEKTADPFAKSGISPCFPVSKKTLFQQEMNKEQEKTGAQSTNATASQPGNAEEVQQVKEGEEVLVAGTSATPAAEAGQPSQWGIVTRLQSQKLTAALEEDKEQASTSLGHQPSPPPTRQRKRRRHRLLLLRSTAIWAQNCRRPHSSSSKDHVMHRILRELALMKRRMQNMAWEMDNVQKKLDDLIDHIN